MASTIAHRALEIVKERTTANLARQMYGSSFALDEASRLSLAARSAARTIADSQWPLNNSEQTVVALVKCGYRASAFTKDIEGIRAYANSRRSTS